MSTTPSERRRDGGTHVSFGKFRQIDIPNFERYGEGEQLDTALVHLEALLEVLVLFEELRIVDNDLSIGNLELEDLIVCSLCGFNGPQGFFEVDIERPEFKRFEKSGLGGQRLLDRSDEPGSVVRVSGTYVVVVTDFSILGNHDRTLHHPNGFVVVPVR